MNKKLSLKRILLIIAVAILTPFFVFSISACSNNNRTNQETTQFVVLSTEIISISGMDIYYAICYDRDTRVMYVCSFEGYIGNRISNFTVLLNPDGTPRIYEGE